MDLLLKDGDLVPGTDGLPVPVEGREELLQRALIRLCARRGGFAPYPGLGSRLYRAGAAGEAELRGLGEEALAGLPLRRTALTVDRQAGGVWLGLTLEDGEEPAETRLLVTL